MNQSQCFVQIEALWGKKRFISVGLDTSVEKLPESIKKDSVEKSLLAFNQAIIDATAEFVCAYKPNSAFYEAYGIEGIAALKQTIEYVKQKYPEIPVILDAKRADIDNTNEGYIKFAFEYLRADAITVHPYLGKQALLPFLELQNKGIFVLAKTSNKESGEFQDLSLEKKLLYQIVAEHVASSWNINNNCGLVVGATYSHELKKIRETVGDIPILIPGIGAQGGDIKETVYAGKNSKNTGIIINSSRGIIYASNGEDFAQAARTATQMLHNQILDSLHSNG